MESVLCTLGAACTGLASVQRLAASPAADSGGCFIHFVSRYSSKPSSSRSSWDRKHAGRMVHLKASSSASQIELKTDSDLPRRSTTIRPVEQEKERIDELVGEIKDMFRSMNDGETSPSAYDTAWVARIASADDPNKPHFPTTLDWILSNQLEDGSWGEPSFFLLYDRLLCTLSCILALQTWKIGEDHIDRGVKFLTSHVKDLEKESESHMLCGFEIAFPSLLKEAKCLGIRLPYDLPCLNNIIKLREKKISRIPMEVMHSIHTALLYTLEALQQVVQWEKILKLQSTDGSFASSLAATAAAYMRTGDKKCLKFLTTVVTRFEGCVPCQYPVDLYERIWAIDTVERLGIGHHFTKEILDTLDYIFRNMRPQGISWGRDNPILDIDDTCMMLRLMRLHGYPISSDMLEFFRDCDGNFVCFAGQTHRGVSDMFNLYRVAQIAFPGEKILKEARSFVEEYLKDCVEKNEFKDKWSIKKALDKEVGHALKHPWRSSFQRLEAREYIDHYGVDDVWIAKTLNRMYYITNPKYLQLAKLDYNQLQTMYKKEMNYIHQWWSGYGFDDPIITSVCPKETHFSIAATLYEPQFSASRIAYTKSNCIEDVLKDIFDKHESEDDLKLMCEAVEQWNSSLVNSLPIRLKMAFKIMHDALNELAAQASKAQGKNMFSHFLEFRKKQMQAYMKTREIQQGTCVVSFKEYINHRKKELGITIRVVPALLVTGEHLKDLDILFLNEESWLQDQVSLFLRLFMDVQMHKSSQGNKVNAISLWMFEEKCTEEEALIQLKAKMEEAFDQVVHETLKPSLVSRSSRRLIFEHARIKQFFLTDASPTKQNKGLPKPWTASLLLFDHISKYYIADEEDTR